MFSFFKKHRFTFDVLGTLVFGWGAVEMMLEYTGPEGKATDLFRSVVFGIMSVIKLVDVIIFLRKNKRAEQARSQ